jgi:hypothetical protein
VKRFFHFRDLEAAHGVTWRKLVESEPKLEELLWAARRAGAACRKWSDVDRAFAPIRNALAELVGVEGRRRTSPVLGSAGAIEVAYWRLYDAARGLLPEQSGPEMTPVSAKPSCK